MKNTTSQSADIERSEKPQGILSKGDPEIRRYYAAHAPAAPEWFRLKTGDIPPKIPAVPDNWDTAERAEFAMIKEGTLQPAAACDDVQVFWNRFEPARLRAEAWRDEMRQKKFFAWRWYYADMMLETERGES